MRAVSFGLMQHQALESCVWKPECELKQSADSAPLLWDDSKYSMTGSQNTESYKCEAGRTMQELTTLRVMSSARSLSQYEDHSANRLARH